MMKKKYSDPHSGVKVKAERDKKRLRKDSRTLRVLIVDEDEDLIEFMSFQLKMRGYEVDCTGIVYLALQLVERIGYDVILVDARFPQKDGVELMQRARKRRPDTALILMSSMITVESDIEVMSDGVYCCLKQPLQSMALLAVLEKAVDHRRTALQRPECPQCNGKMDHDGYFCAYNGQEIRNIDMKTLETFYLFKRREGIWRMEMKWIRYDLI